MGSRGDGERGTRRRNIAFLSSLSPLSPLSSLSPLLPLPTPYSLLPTPFSLLNHLRQRIASHRLRVLTQQRRAQLWSIKII